MTMMPNKKEQEEIREGVKKMVRGWEQTGKIRTSRAEYAPKTKERAIKQSLAIEYGEHKVSQRRKEKE